MGWLESLPEFIRNGSICSGDGKDAGLVALICVNDGPELLKQCVCYHGIFWGPHLLQIQHSADLIDKVRRFPVDRNVLAQMVGELKPRRFAKNTHIAKTADADVYFGDRHPMMRLRICSDCVERNEGQLVAGTINYQHKFALRKRIEVIVNSRERLLDLMERSFYLSPDQ
ncbi:hypothetical protein TcWFU_005880 [Taenia crassiceps]|uniref:Uncharacterized protein n=1 Tax=Taenia crassiceps TaxID=6207 RepID=A0ABR4Q047_9CEST